MSPIDSLDAFVTLWSFVFGSAVGSFLHVVAHRLPQRRPFVASRSRCPRCRLLIRPWHNVPILGWLALGGRCRDCRGRIPWRYPAAELAAGCVFAGCWLRYGATLELVAAWGWASLFLTLALLDFDARILPFELTLPATALALILPLVAPGASWVRWPEAIVTALAAGAFALVADVAWRQAAGAPGLASGDAAFLALLGAIFGARGLAAISIAAGAAVAVAAGLSMLRGRLGAVARRRRGVPVGTYLGVAATVWLVVGDVASSTVRGFGA